MQITVAREVLLKPLTRIISAVQRNSTLPVLSNALLRAGDGMITLVGTDLEVEIMASCPAKVTSAGETTVHARKLFDIVRALPDGSQLKISVSGDKATVTAGRSRYVLSTTSASEFPVAERDLPREKLAIAEGALRDLLDRTSFAMARNDQRAYLNGVLFEVTPGLLRCVATDSCRIAICETPVHGATESRQAIVPYKAVNELHRMLEQGGEGQVQVDFGDYQLRVLRDNVILTTKLIAGQFPDYAAFIPQETELAMELDLQQLRSTLSLAAVVAASNEYRNVSLTIERDKLRVEADNPQRDNAKLELPAKSTVHGQHMSFNVEYLQQALGALQGERVVLKLQGRGDSLIVRGIDSHDCRQVLMPVRV